VRIDPRQLAAFEGGVRHTFARELASLLGEGAVPRIEALIAHGISRGLGGRRAVGAFVLLEMWRLPSHGPRLTDETLGPLDTRMLDHLDAAPLDAAQRRIARRVLAEPLARLDEPITPRAALMSLRLAPRGAEEAHAIELVLANGPRDPVGPHWAARVDERVLELMALTRPRSANVHAHLRWYGGAPVADEPSIRRLPLDQPGRHRVAVELDGRADVFHLWVLDVRNGRIVPDDAPATIPSACRSLGLGEHMSGQLDP
jgi:hypothetical protein